MKKVKIKINAENLKRKLKLKDGYSPVKGKDYFDGYTPIKGKDYFDGEDGKTPDTLLLIAEVIEKISPLIPKIEQIKKDIPLLGEEIRDSLELLQGEERLDKSAIKGLEELELQIKEGRKIVGGGSIARNFYQLFDVPQTYKGQSGKFLRVKSTEDALEFVASASGTPVDNETPTGVINGTNTGFTLAYTPITGSLKVYINGQRLKETDDYSLSGTTLTMVNAPITGSTFLVDYRY